MNYESQKPGLGFTPISLENSGGIALRNGAGTGVSFGTDTTCDGATRRGFYTERKSKRSCPPPHFAPALSLAALSLSRVVVASSTPTRSGEQHSKRMTRHAPLRPRAAMIAPGQSSGSWSCARSRSAAIAWGADGRPPLLTLTISFRCAMAGRMHTATYNPSVTRATRRLQCDTMVVMGERSR